MVLGGLQKLTLLDFPGRVACTVFTMGCNFRCPFCHNSPLVLTAETPVYDTEEFFRFLEKRQGILDGVAVTGGEPLLQKDIGPFLERIKALGYSVKLDTNGAFPAVLRELVSRGLVDYVAMDIKNAPEKYDETAGVPGMLSAVRESVEFLLSGAVPYEFRTTAVAELHTEEDFRGIGRWIAGCPRYYIQQFTDSGDILCPGMTQPGEETMKKYLQAAREFVPAAELRGL